MPLPGNILMWKSKSEREHARRQQEYAKLFAPFLFTDAELHHQLDAATNEGMPPKDETVEESKWRVVRRIELMCCYCGVTWWGPCLHPCLDCDGGSIDLIATGDVHHVYVPK